MLPLFRSAAWFCAAIILALGLSVPVSAADRSATLLPSTDLPGFDYSVLKDSSVNACTKACTDDKLCKAFTFNEKAGWCFLKGDVGPETKFDGATSGRISMAPTAESIAADRQSELPFPAQDLIDSARYFLVGLPKSDPPPPKVSYADLVGRWRCRCRQGRSGRCHGVLPAGPCDQRQRPGALDEARRYGAGAG